MKSLMIIDDHSLRVAAFREAEKLIHKIERLEQDIASFNDQDQSQFRSWLEVTFRSEHQALEELEDEHRALVQKFNQIGIVAELYDIEMSEAFSLLRREDELYKSGSAADRERIEEERAHREQQLRETLKQRYETDEDEEGARADAREDEEEKANRRERTEDEIAELRALERMSDQKLRETCYSLYQAFDTLWTVLEYGRTNRDLKLLLRVWNLTSPRNQTAFSRQFAKQVGYSFKKMIKSIEAKLQHAEFNGEDLDDEYDPDENEDTDESDPSAAEERVKTTKKSAQAEALENVKLLYRKLVRRLHPDLQGEQDYWQKQMWARVQTAYQKENLGDLRKLWSLVLLRSRNLNELSMSEIIESQLSLQRELDRMTYEAKGFKNLPAWRFSKRKTYEALERKLSKTILRDMKTLRDKVEVIRQQFSFFEMFSRDEDRAEARRSRRRR